MLCNLQDKSDLQSTVPKVLLRQQDVESLGTHSCQPQQPENRLNVLHSTLELHAAAASQLAGRSSHVPVAHTAAKLAEIATTPHVAQQAADQVSPHASAAA